MRKLLALTAGLALAASAQAGLGTGTQTDYAAYTVGAPLKEIRYFQLYNWQRSTDRAVVLWTKPSEAYMLSLENNCDMLRGSQVSIQIGGVAAVPGRLAVGDDLLVGAVKCRVGGIQAIDLKAVKADRDAKKLKKTS
jgi:hypothetical protein